MKIRHEICKCEGITYTYVLNSSSDGTRGVYSVEISMRSDDGEINTYARGELYEDYNRSYVLFCKLVKHLATPINLPYVLADENS